MQDSSTRFRTFSGSYENWIFAVFKCKDDCDTIFELDRIKDMMRFTETTITADPTWPKVCVRDLKPIQDKFGCSKTSYNNLTYPLEPYIRANYSID